LETGVNGESANKIALKKDPAPDYEQKKKERRK